MTLAYSIYHDNESQATRDRTLPAAQSASQPITAFGHFDLIDGDYAEGWAWCPDLPDQRVTVEILHDTEVVASGIANLPREDLAGAGIGDGHYRFKIKLPLSLRDGTARLLSARAAGNHEPLHDGPHCYEAEPLTLDWTDLIDAASTSLFARHIEASLPTASSGFAAQLTQVHQLIETDAYTDALMLLEQMMRRFGSHALLHCKMAECHLLGYHIDEAAAAYQHAIDADRHFAPAYLGLGNCHARNAAWLEADDAYQTGLKLAPGDQALARRAQAVSHDARIARATQAWQTGDADGAITLLKQGLLAAPDHDGMTVALGTILQETAGANGTAPMFSALLYEQLLFDFWVEEAEYHLERGNR